MISQEGIKDIKTERQDDWKTGKQENTSQTGGFRGKQP
jgi:hypothetical protein